MFLEKLIKVAERFSLSNVNRQIVIDFSTHEVKGLASTFSLNFREFYETLIISCLLFRVFVLHSIHEKKQQRHIYSVAHINVSSFTSGYRPPTYRIQFEHSTTGPQTLLAIYSI